MKININSALDFPLEDGAIDEVYKTAFDDYEQAFNEVFFFGKLIDSDNNHTIDEKKYYSFCPVCGELFSLRKKPNNGDEVYCPQCGQQGTLYDYRDPNCLQEETYEHYGYLELMDHGYVLRLFEAMLDFSNRGYDNYEKLSCEPDFFVLEVGREYCCDGKISYYASDDGEVFQEVRTLSDGEYWIVNYDNAFDPTFDSARVENLIDNDPYQAKTFIEAVARRVPYRTFLTLMRYGFRKLASEMIYIPHVFGESAKITEILGADYNQIKAQFDVDEFDIEDLTTVKGLREIGLKVSAANAEIMKALHKSLSDLSEIASPQKIFKYLRNQGGKNRQRCAAVDYLDYINECKKLKYDLSAPCVTFPSDLRKAHRITSKLMTIDKNTVYEEKINDIYARNHALCEWTDGKYCIVMPNSAAEIVTEGAAQNHCVGNYCERVAKEESVVLFLRRTTNPAQAFYTLEIQPNYKRLTVVQCRGYGNTDYSEEIRAEVDGFLNRYTQWFNKRPVKEAKGTEKRIYYKAVRKTSDGRYISAWDGKTEYKIGSIVTSKLCTDPDKVAVAGIHVASLNFAMNYGDSWSDAAILEIEVDINDIVIPDAKDQIRTRSGRVLREVPMNELGEWGVKHSKSNVA